MKKISARVMIDGNCINCGADTTVGVNLGGLVQVNTGGIFRRKDKLFMEAEIDPDEHVCEECGFNYFDGTVEKA